MLVKNDKAIIKLRRVQKEFEKLVVVDNSDTALSVQLNRLIVEIEMLIKRRLK